VAYASVGVAVAVVAQASVALAVVAQAFVVLAVALPVAVSRPLVVVQAFLMRSIDSSIYFVFLSLQHS
jgi:hypothetical protein